MERGNERRLLQQVRKGDADAFASLYQDNVQAVFRYIAYRVNDTHLAEDLTGDVFMRALRYHEISSGAARDDATAGGREKAAESDAAQGNTAARRR